MAARDPMARFAEAMTLAEEGLRQAMHAIHDTPAGTSQGDWYDRIGQLHAITDRTNALLGAIGTRVDGLPLDRLRSTDGTSVKTRIEVVLLELHWAARAVFEANRHVNAAWSRMGVIAERDPEGGPS